MAMIATRQRRTREILGNLPQSVGIIEKPRNKNGPEKLLIEWRKKAAEKEAQDQLVAKDRFIDLRNDWERVTQNKLQKNQVLRKVQAWKQIHEFTLEDRKAKLRRMLMREEQQYLEEMAASQETLLERQAKMREKARRLKEDREQDRLEFVQQKLDEQWRNQCHELRATLSKRHQDQVAVERLDQMRIKDDIAKARQEEEKMYAELWYADMMVKAKREEEEEKKRMEANKGVVEVLQQQMAALEAKKEEEKLLIAEEAELLQQQAELRKLEEMHAQEEKRRKQEETRRMLDRTLQLKRQKEARDLQEQLAFDMKILEQLLEETRNEARETAQRKKELREEDQRYRQYLQQLKEEEAQRERELEKLCDIEVEKAWERRIKQWRLEKEARRKLLQEVMESRKHQLQLRLIENENRQKASYEEKEMLKKRIAENQRIEREEAQKLWQKKQNYQQDLLGQIHYNRDLKHADVEESVRMWQAQDFAEREYRTKLELALTNPIDQHAHPIRRRFTQSCGPQMMVQGRSGRMN